MNEREKEVAQYLLEQEKTVLKKIESQFRAALNSINMRIALMQTDEMTASQVLRVQYQKTLKAQVSAILEKLHADEYNTIEQFAQECYKDGFIGTMYNLHGQNIPIILSIDNNAAAKAIVTDSKIKTSLYEELGVDVAKLKSTIAEQLTIGIASNQPYINIAHAIRNATGAPLKRAKTIVRTEAHRIQQASQEDARQEAKAKGAEVVKQWDAILDGRTRDNHARLDGQIREVDEPFTIGGKKAMYPGAFGDPAEDCNCRCVALTRARAALDADELATMKQRAKFFKLDKTKNFKDFREKYLKTTDDWAAADAIAKKHLNMNLRDDLGEIVARGTTKIQQGISAFSKDDILYERAKDIKPDGNKFDVAMHGTTTAVAFGGREANMTPRVLASLIRHSEGYNGQEIRLLSCSTGQSIDGEYCFAEELANALGVTVYAPNDLLYIGKGGIISVGDFGTGKFIPYKPNERKRLK